MQRHIKRARNLASFSLSHIVLLKKKHANGRRHGHRLSEGKQQQQQQETTCLQDPKAGALRRVVECHYLSPQMMPEQCRLQLFMLPVWVSIWISHHERCLRRALNLMCQTKPHRGTKADNNVSETHLSPIC